MASQAKNGSLVPKAGEPCVQEKQAEKQAERHGNAIAQLEGDTLEAMENEAGDLQVRALARCVLLYVTACACECARCALRLRVLATPLNGRMPRAACVRT